MTAQSSRRAGGCLARRTARAAPLAEHLRPVRAGLPGGRYQPLSQEGLERIRQAVLEALETIGLADAPQSGIDHMIAAGAILGEDGRLRFPRTLIEDTIASANRSITLFSRDGKNDLELSGRNVHFGTASVAFHIVDVEGRNYRDSTLQDLFDAARLTDKLDNIHFLQRPMVCRDIQDNREMDLNTVYACCVGTTKHVGTSFTEVDFARDAFKMLHMIDGGEDKWRTRPFVSNSNCFVVPPMKFATESCLVMEECIHQGMPVLLLSAGQAGATAPAPIAGAIVQAVAECLAGLFYVQSIKRGHPVIFGTWPFVSDLRTGAMSGGSGEQALLTAGCAQMHQFYSMPGGAAAGIADAKLPNMQAGWEQAISNVMARLSGLNMVYEAAGMHASLLGFCPESLVLGNDLLGQAMRCVRGIEVTDDTVSTEVMQQTCMGGPGHFLGSDQTLSVMQTEYIYPELGDRSSPKEWDELGKPDLIQKAIARKDAIMSQPSSAHFTPDVDCAIRTMFKIHLQT